MSKAVISSSGQSARRTRVGVQEEACAARAVERPELVARDARALQQVIDQRRRPFAVGDARAWTARRRGSAPAPSRRAGVRAVAAAAPPERRYRLQLVADAGHVAASGVAGPRRRRPRASSQAGAGCSTHAQGLPAVELVGRADLDARAAADAAHLVGRDQTGVGGVELAVRRSWDRPARRRRSAGRWRPGRPRSRRAARGSAARPAARPARAAGTCPGAPRGSGRDRRPSRAACSARGPVARTRPAFRRGRRPGARRPQDAGCRPGRPPRSCRSAGRARRVAGVLGPGSSPPASASARCVSVWGRRTELAS